MDNNDRCDERSFDSALRREMDYLLASNMFRKSPRLSQLLAYLVAATLRGEGETLKSYTVAVDGLGRAADFDAQADSYPRVQVMRLRNFLSSFYARYEPSGELCIYILPGSYRVRMAKFAIAYPDIVVRSARRRLDGQAAEAAEFESAQPKEPVAFGITNAAVQTTPAVAAKADVAMSQLRTWLKAPRPLLTGGLVAATLIALAVFWPNITPSGAGSHVEQAPTLIISDIASSSDSQSRDLAVQVEHALENGIASSWVVDALGSAEEGRTSGVNGADYRIDASLTRPDRSGQQLLIELVSKPDGRIIWSNVYPLNFKEPIQLQLQPALSQIASPLGVIGRRELARAGEQRYAGYTCLLAAQFVIAGKNVASRDKVSQCLPKAIADTRLEAVRLASMAMAMVQDSIINAKPAPMVKAESLAERAIEIDPDEGAGHFALAWMKYIQNRCDAGNFHAAAAMRRNSYDPTALAYVANFAEECALPGGDELVERALANRVEGRSTIGLAIVNLALKSGRTDILSAINQSGDARSSSANPTGLLSDAIIAAYFDNIEASRRSWTAFVKSQRQPEATPDELLQQLVFSKANRARIVALLTEKNVLTPA